MEAPKSTHVTCAHHTTSVPVLIFTQFMPLWTSREVVRRLLSKISCGTFSLAAAMYRTSIFSSLFARRQAHDVCICKPPSQPPQRMTRLLRSSTQRNRMFSSDLTHDSLSLHFEPDPGPWYGSCSGASLFHETSHRPTQRMSTQYETNVTVGIFLAVSLGTGGVF